MLSVRLFSTQLSQGKAVRRRQQGRFEVLDLESQSNCHEEEQEQERTTGKQQPNANECLEGQEGSSRSSSRESVRSGAVVSKLWIAGRFQVQDLDAKLDVVPKNTSNVETDESSLNGHSGSDDSRGTTKVAGRFEVCDIIANAQMKESIEAKDLQAPCLRRASTSSPRDGVNYIQPTKSRPPPSQQLKQRRPSPPNKRHHQHRLQQQPCQDFSDDGSSGSNGNVPATGMEHEELNEISAVDLLTALSHKVKRLESMNIELRLENERLNRDLKQLRRSRQ